MNLEEIENMLRQTFKEKSICITDDNINQIAKQIYGKAQKFSRCDNDFKDIVQDLLFIVLKCIIEYNPERGDLVSYIKSSISEWKLPQQSKSVSDEQIENYPDLKNENNEEQEAIEFWESEFEVTLQEDINDLELQIVKSYYKSKKFISSKSKKSKDIQEIIQEIGHYVEGEDIPENLKNLLNDKEKEYIQRIIENPNYMPENFKLWEIDCLWVKINSFYSINYSSTDHQITYMEQDYPSKDKWGPDSDEIQDLQTD